MGVVKHYPELCTEWLVVQPLVISTYLVSCISIYLGSCILPYGCPSVL